MRPSRRSHRRIDCFHCLGVAEAPGLLIIAPEFRAWETSLSTEWNMPHRADACAACGRGFEIGQTFQAFLYEAETGYARRDFCCECEPPAEPAALGHWKTRRPEPAAKKIVPFDREAIYGFFERLEDATEPSQVQFRFVLALLLWRKKVLKLERTVPGSEGEVWEFITVRTATPHRVVRPDLGEEELERLSTQLEQLLATAPGELDLSGRGVTEGKPGA